MLDKQERDRVEEKKARERRAQDFMNRMADTVIKKMDARNRQEEDKIRRYELEKEMRDRMEDERRQHKQKSHQQEMRQFLAKQVDERKKREEIEKALNDEQAVMWSKDAKNYADEERRMHDKVKRINEDNANFLIQQMNEKQGKKKQKMNAHEYGINKGILEEI